MPNAPNMLNSVYGISGTISASAYGAAGTVLIQGSSYESGGAGTSYSAANTTGGVAYGITGGVGYGVTCTGFDLAAQQFRLGASNTAFAVPTFFPASESMYSAQATTVHMHTWRPLDEQQLLPTSNTLIIAAWNELEFLKFSKINSSTLSHGNRFLSWKDQLVAEIASYAYKSEGWDGYDAKKILPEAIADAQAFIALLPDYVEPPHDQPCADGEVSLVWRKESRFGEVGFPGNHTFYWYATDGERHAGDDDVPIRFGLPRHLRDIMDMRRVQPGKSETSVSSFLYGQALLAA